MGTHLRVLSESYPMNTHMTWFRWFSEIFAFLDKSSLSIGRVKTNDPYAYLHGFHFRAPRLQIHLGLLQLALHLVFLPRLSLGFVAAHLDILVELERDVHKILKPNFFIAISF